MGSGKITEEVRELLELELSLLKKDFERLNKHTGKILCIAFVSFAALCGAIIEIFNKSIDNLTLVLLVLGIAGCAYSWRLGLREWRLQNRIRQIESALRTGLIDI